MTTIRTAHDPRFDKAAIGLAPATAIALMLMASWIVPAEPLTALLGALLTAYLLMSPAIANGAALRLALPFAIMIAWGLAMSSGNDGYIIGKDVWYAGKLCLALMLGFLAGIRPIDHRSLARVLIVLAAVMAVAMIALWLFVGGTIGDVDGEDVSRLPLVATVAFVPLLDQARDSTGVARGKAIGLLGLIALAVLVSNSRITIIAAGVMVLAWSGLFSRTRRALLGGLAVILLLVLLWRFLPEYTGGELTVATKFRRSLEELLFTDSFDTVQMRLNWRGFEAYNAQLMFDQSSLLRKLLGNGLGSVVDLGQEIAVSQDASYRFIPILHNGFYYILVKYGLLGVIMYVFAILRFGLLGKVSADNLAMEDRMLRGMIVTTLLATMVITGLYNKTEMSGLTLLTGGVIGFAQRRRYERDIGLARDEAA